MKFSLIAVGRGAPKPIKILTDEYMERLQRMAPTTLLEVAEERRSAAAGSREQILLKEAGRVRRKIPPGALLVPLVIDAPAIDSMALAARIGKHRDGGIGEICFLIGGPDGLHPSLTREPWQLSFGPMTFPHMLARAMLLEQLYRAMTILERVPYHR